MYSPPHMHGPDPKSCCVHASPFNPIVTPPGWPHPRTTPDSLISPWRNLISGEIKILHLTCISPAAVTCGVLRKDCPMRIGAASACPRDWASSHSRRTGIRQTNTLPITRWRKVFSQNPSMSAHYFGKKQGKKQAR
jgi:hypothetical protein